MYKLRKLFIVYCLVISTAFFWKKQYSDGLYDAVREFAVRKIQHCNEKHFRVSNFQSGDKYLTLVTLQGQKNSNVALLKFLCPFSRFQR
jgi:hypothetical protein